MNRSATGLISRALAMCTSTFLCAVVFATGAPSTVRAAGVVGTGTAASCTDAALNAALAGGGVVTFDCGGPATIDISPGAGGSGTKTVATDTTVDGGGLITLSGGNSVSVFMVNLPVTFSVQNLTIANSAGGGINVNPGTLTVTNSTFAGNTNGNGGAINNAGTATVTNSTFSGNTAGVGGAIGSRGTLTVTNSTFSGNTADVGEGAIDNEGTLTVTNSTFSSNTASTTGGAIGTCGPLTVANSTFTGNTAGAGGAISAVCGPVTVTNSTFTGNTASNTGDAFGGAIFVQSTTVTVTNTILATSAAGGNCSGNTIVDGGHNLDDGTTCNFGGTGCTTASGSSFCNTDPRLGPAGLGNNGGPTQTIPLCTGRGTPATSCTGASPAIGAGDPVVCAMAPVNNLDQRGFVRPGTGHTNCSIGAYEADSPGALTPTPTASGTQTPTATPIPLVVSGTCMQPGAQGLVPCDPGTTVTVLQCTTDLTCNPDTLTQLASTQIGAAGAFSFMLDSAQVMRRRLVFEASFPPAARLRGAGGTAAQADTQYRIIDFGLAAGGGGLNVVIDPNSEAAVRLLYQNGMQNYSNDAGTQVIQAVQAANANLTFAGLDVAAAAMLATETASMDPVVQDTLRRLQLECAGDCDGSGDITVDEIVTLVSIALGSNPLSACLIADADHNAQITIDEIVRAVNKALNGCAS